MRRYQIAFFLLLMSAAGSFGQTVWEQIVAAPEQTVWATSALQETLGGRRIRYPATNLFDGDIATSWVEDVPGDGVGESVTFAVNGTVQEMRVVSGFARNERLYSRNGRPHRIKISLVAAFTAPGMVSETNHQLYLARSLKATQPVSLDDTRSEQVMPFPFDEDQQQEHVQVSLEAFLEDHPVFLDAIAKDLGYGDTANLMGRQLAAFFRDVSAAYSMICVRIEIADVYPGTHYRDTCISEVSVDISH